MRKLKALSLASAALIVTAAVAAVTYGMFEKNAGKTEPAGPAPASQQDTQGDYSKSKGENSSPIPANTELPEADAVSVPTSATPETGANTDAGEGETDKAADTSKMISPALSVIASNLSMTKSGMVGNNVTFSAADFDRAIGINTVASITLLSLPDPAVGTVTLNGQPVRRYQTIKRSDMSALSFEPACTKTACAEFTYGVVGTSDQYEINCKVWLLEALNFAPGVGKAASSSSVGSIKTFENVAYYGVLDAKDPEGDAITFEITSYPGKGLLIMTDASAGEYKYVPAANMTGRDSFSYCAYDIYGNVSPEIRVGVTVQKADRDMVYEDMTDSYAHNAAIVLAKNGVLIGETVGGSKYFSPDSTITRAQFLTAAMKALGCECADSSSALVFEDSNEIPAAMKGYVGAAYKYGYVSGIATETGIKFNPRAAITRAEAAVILNNILALETPDAGATAVFAGEHGLPAWAAEPCAALASAGIISTHYGAPLSSVNELMTREEAALTLAAAMNYAD